MKPLHIFVKQHHRCGRFCAAGARTQLYKFFREDIYITENIFLNFKLYRYALKRKALKIFFCLIWLWVCQKL